MKTLIHISDLHIQPANYVNFKESYQRLVFEISQIPDYKSEVVLVICGDIFDHKHSLRPNDIALFGRFMKALNNFAIQTVIIPGNHDLNLNNDGHDMVSLLMELSHDAHESKSMASVGNVHCLIGTQVRCLFGVQFVYYGLDGRLPSAPSRQTHRPLVALLHEPINGARNSQEITESRSRFSIGDLASQYDLVLLGDIHVTQFLTPNMAYCGSFVQCSKAESMEKGYIRWDYRGDRYVGTFKAIPLREVYLVVESKENNTILPELPADVTIRFLQLEHTDCSPDYVQTIAATIAETYHRSIDSIRCRRQRRVAAPPLPPTSPSRHCDLDFRELGTQEALMRELLQSYPRDQVEAILTMHRQKIAEARLSRQARVVRQWRVKFLFFSNLYCFTENNYVVFDGMKGLVSISGANATGKSAIIDILTLALFNCNSKGKREDCLNMQRSTGELKCCFEVSGKTYVIERKFSRKQSRSVLNQTHRLLEGETNLTAASLPQTYEVMRDTLGLGSYQDFVDTSLALQNREFLVDCKESTKHKILSRIIDLEEIEHIFALVDDDRRFKERLMRDTKKQLEKLTSDECPRLFEQHLNPVAFFNTLREEHVQRARRLQANEQQLRVWQTQHADVRERMTGLVIHTLADWDRNITQCIMDLNRLDEEIAALEAQQLPSVEPKYAKADLHARRTKAEQAMQEHRRLLSVCEELDRKDHEIHVADLSHFWVQVEELLKARAVTAQYKAESASTSEALVRSLGEARHLLASLGASTICVPDMGYSGPLDSQTVRQQLSDHLTKRAVLEVRRQQMRSLEEIELELAACEDPAEPELESFVGMYVLEEFDHLREMTKAVLGETLGSFAEYEVPHQVVLARGDLTSVRNARNALKQPTNCTHRAQVVAELKRLEEQAEVGRQQRTAEMTQVYENLKRVDAEIAQLHNQSMQAMMEVGAQRERKQWLQLLHWNFNEQCGSCGQLRQLVMERATTMHDVPVPSLDQLAELWGARAELQKSLNEVPPDDPHLITLREASKTMAHNLHTLAQAQQIIADQIHNEAAPNLERYHTARQRWVEASEQVSTRRLMLQRERNQVLRQPEVEAEFLLHTGEIDRLTRLVAHMEATKQELQDALRRLLEQLVFNVHSKAHAKQAQLQSHLQGIQAYEEQWRGYDQYQILLQLQQYRALFVEATELQRQIDSANSTLKEDQERFTQLDLVYQKMSEKLQLTSALESELVLLTLYCKCIDLKTGIPQVALSNVKDSLQQRCNDVLREVADFKVHFTISQTTDMTKTKRSKFLEIFIVDSNEAHIHASLASGSQRFILDLVLRVVLMQISYASRPNFLMIDEGFGCLDETHFARVKQMLPQLLKHFCSVVVISHQADLYTEFDQFVQIRRTDTCSNVQFGNLSSADQTLHGLVAASSAARKMNAEIKEARTQQLCSVVLSPEALQVMRQRYRVIADHHHVAPGTYRRTSTMYKNDCRQLYYEYIDFMFALFATEDADKYKCTVCDRQFAQQTKRIALHYGSTALSSKHLEAFIGVLAGA